MGVCSVMSLTELYKEKIVQDFIPLIYIGESCALFTRGHIYLLRRAETAFGMVDMDLYDANNDQTICESYFPDEMLKKWRLAKC